MNIIIKTLNRHEKDDGTRTGCSVRTVRQIIIN